MHETKGHVHDLNIACCAKGAGPDRQSAGAVKHSTLDAEHAAAVTQPVKVPAEREVASPLRLWLFTYMSSVLGLVAAQGANGRRLKACATGMCGFAAQHGHRRAPRSNGL